MEEPVVEDEDDTMNKPQEEADNKVASLEIETEKPEKSDDESDAAKPLPSRSYLVVDCLKDWAATLLIGFLVTTYWRGTWTLMDIWDCDQPADANPIDGDFFCNSLDVRSTTRRNSGILSYFLGLGLIAIGVAMSWTGMWSPPDEYISPVRAAIRAVMLYILGFGTVNLWRGIWYLLDYLVLWEKDEQLKSWWCTTLAGAGGAFLLFTGASLLAPPAIFLLDGPSVDSPPVAVTILSTYFDIRLPAKTKPPDLSWWVVVVDIFTSFIVVPILVVGYWRGFWMLMDNYLWGFVGQSEFNASLGYSTIIALFCLGVASDDVFYFIKIQNSAVKHVVMRFRTLVLAIGAVNFWRVVWYAWDQYMGYTSQWSAWLAHALGVLGLLTIGCLSCITAPASTLGVDVVACDDCADEPLFSNVPVPAEALFALAIGRQPFEKSKREREREEQQKNEYRRQQMEQLQRLGGATLHIVTYCEVQRRGNRISRQESIVMVARLSRRNQLKRQSPFYRSR